jgi:epoxyqueuosine reductase
MDIKKFIIDKSKELNIDMIGFTNSDPLFNLEEYLKYRIDNDVITEFEEKDINKRIDPKVTMSNCKSIITIALSYNVDLNEKSSVRFKGSLSKSSWGIDYHRVLKSKIIDLIEEIKRIQDFEYKYFVDTGPLVDRELAKKSGLGYYGKNCNIINEEYGSFIFIGYILTDLEIDVDNYSKDNECGDCVLCIKACPTNALEEPFRLNPKKCISYLTQTKGPLDIDLKEKMGIKIYGCDTCQMVCPKNKDIKKSEHDEFMPYITKGIIDIEELLKMSNKEFKVKYGTMAGSWRGKNILKRNCINALQNIKNEKNKHCIDDILETHE